MLARSRGGDKSGGAIVNISSDAGRRGTIGQINYGAAKAGLLGMTMCAAREWAKYNVRVNTIGFGVVETPMTETIRSEKFADTYLRRSRWAAGPSRGSGTAGVLPAFGRRVLRHGPAPVGQRRLHHRHVNGFP